MKKSAYVHGILYCVPLISHIQVYRNLLIVLGNIVWFHVACVLNKYNTSHDNHMIGSHTNVKI